MTDRRHVPNTQRATLRLTSPWLWPALGFVAIALAGWLYGRVAALATAAGLVILCIGIGLGLLAATTAGIPSPAAAPDHGPPDTDDARAVQPPPGEADGQPARLQGANLKNALLAKANLRFADLRGAELSGADLEEADLRGANLTPLTEPPDPTTT